MGLANELLFPLQGGKALAGFCSPLPSAARVRLQPSWLLGFERVGALFSETIHAPPFPVVVVVAGG